MRVSEEEARPTNPSRRARDLEDELLIGLHGKWNSHTVISNRKFTHEQPIDPSKNARRTIQANG